MPLVSRVRVGALRGRPVAGYGLAVAAAAVALAARLGVDSVFPPGTPFLFFFPAVIATAFIAGRGPAIVTAMLSLLAAWYVLIPPYHSFELTDAAAALPLFGFTLVSSFAIVIVDAMQTALDKLARERQVTARLYDQQRLLFAELQHRVANNMAFVSGLLRLQRRRIAADPANAVAALDDAAARIEMMGRIHRQLHDPATSNGAYPRVITEICQDLARAIGVDGIEFRIDLPSEGFDPDTLMSLSLLIAEAVTNALKHGFAGRSSGIIEIRLCDAAGQREVIIRDNGMGVPAGTGATTGPGLGLRIMHGLAEQLGGGLAWANDNGTVVRLTLPK